MSPRSAAWVGLAAVLVLEPARPALALDPGRAVTQYVITKWSRSGLPSNSIHTVYQTRDRYLWLGTGGGLVRFDGVRFVGMGDSEARDSADGGVARLVEGPDGALFIGTTSGKVLRYHEGTITRLHVRPGSGLVSSLLITRDGSLWIAMHGRPVYRWKDGRVTSFMDRIRTIAPLALVEDKGEGLWIGTRREGLWRFANGEFSRHEVTRDAVQALLFDRSGALWIGTPHGLFCLRGGKTERFTQQDGLSHDNVTAILEDRDGNLWVGTAGGGLNRMTNGRFSRLSVREGLSDDDIRCLLEDHEGNIWVGTADGVNCLSEGRFVTYGRFEGLPDPSVLSVIGSADGGLWIGMTSAGIAKLRDGRLEHLPLPRGSGADSVVSLFEARDRSLWISVDNAKLLRLERGTLHDERPLDAPQNWKIPLIFEDAQGPVFFVTGSGLARIRDGHVRAIGPRGLNLRYLHIAHRDAKGALWLGASAGLARIRGDDVRFFTAKDGLADDRVRWLSEDEDGSLWAATIGGLAHIEGDRIRSLTVREGLPENYLRVVLDDKLGHLWIASMGRLFRVGKQEVRDVLSGKRARISPLLFDSSDGLRASEAPLGNNPAFRGPDGRLWFATSRGVAVVDPARIRVDEPAPDVFLERVTVDGSATRRAEYPSGRGEVSIEYTALSFRSAYKLRFRHRLEGLDRDWVDAGQRRSAYYSNLPPGHYRFLVMASNRDGVWNGRPASFAFSIAYPFVQTPLFFASCGVGAALLAFAAYRLRLRRIRARFAAVIAERTRIARELHDTLAQGLAGVGMQIDTALASLSEEPDEARGHIRLARAMVRSSLAEVRRSIWVLRAQTADRPGGVAATLSEGLQQLTAGQRLATKISVSGSARALPAETERQLLRIAHEAVVNVVTHAEAKTLTIELRFGDQIVELGVRDDGRGFDEPERYLRRRCGDHFGILGMVERAESLGGELAVASRPGEGTEVSCRLPLECRTEPAAVQAAVREEAEA